jgi:predicted enzyme related to lactoylglutathione lyase
MKKNPVAHFEIYGDDPDKLAQFYANLFDWKIEPVPGMDYRIVKTVDTDDKGTPTQPGGINGGVARRPSPEVRGWMNYVSVESVDGAAERAQKLGAKVTAAKAPVPGMGWFVMLVDPQGNPFALWQTDPKAK